MWPGADLKATEVLTPVSVPIGESARERLSDVDRLSHYQEEPSDEKNYRHERDRNEAQNTVPND